MSDRFMDRLNETPVSYGVLLIYLTMAYLTGIFGQDPMGRELDLSIEYGAAVGILVQDGEGWRLITHAFLHGGILHLLLNAYALFILGPALEGYMRTWRFMLLYVVAAVTGALFALAVNVEYVPLVGGSGALFGMLGAALAFNVRGGRTTLDFLENQGARQLIAITVLNLVVGFLIPVVSNSAHVGGLIAGFVLVFCFLDTGRRGGVNTTGRVIQAGWIAVFLSLLLYQLNPVLRFDYNLKQYLRETDPARLRSIGKYLDSYDPFPVFQRIQLVRDEKEPRTGIAGVAWRENDLAKASARKLRNVIPGWKRGE